MMWIDGKLVPQASVSVLDHGFTVGDGVFETIKTISGRPFALTRHLSRLTDSAQGLHLPAPDLRQVRAAIEEVLAVQPFDVGRLRVTWSAGSGGAGSARSQDPSPVLVLTHHEAAAWPENAKVWTAPWPRSEKSPLAQLKTISYAENVLALAMAHEHGADEAIFFNYADQLAEGTGSNIILRIDEHWVTPTIDSGVLAGVTRALAIKWCGVRERSVSRAEFLSADEVVLASSTRDLQAVNMINGRAIAGTSSENVRALISTFHTHAEEEIDP